MPRQTGEKEMIPLTAELQILADAYNATFPPVDRAQKLAIAADESRHNALVSLQWARPEQPIAELTRSYNDAVAAFDLAILALRAAGIAQNNAERAFVDGLNAARPQVSHGTMPNVYSWMG